MKAHSLQTKFMVLFFIFFFVPYGFLTYFSVSMGKGMMEKSTMDHLQNLVEVKETAIEQWLKERVSDGKAIAESEEIKTLDPRRIGSFLSLVKHFEGIYPEIWVLNLSGRIIYGKPDPSPPLKKEWVQRAIEEDAFVLGPTIQSDTQEPAIAILISIKDEKRQTIGIIKELIDLTYVYHLVAEAKLGETGELFIVNPRGEFMLHTRPLKLLKNRIARVPYFQNALLKSTYTGVYKDYAGEAVLGSWKWIEGFQCYLIAEQDVQEAFHQINLLAKKALFIFIISTIVIFCISYWVTGRATGPIKHLSETVVSFANGHFEETFSTDRKDEIGNLVTGFNVMAERLKKAYASLEGKVEASNKELEIAYQMLKQRQEQLIRSEKMAALGQLSAGIAHETRNPLTSIKIFIQSLQKEIDLDESQKEDFRIILGEIDRINENITRFLNFARPEEPLFQRVDVGALVRDTLNLLAAKLRGSGIELDISIPGYLPAVQGDPKQLDQVLLNLLLNAIEAMPQGGTLTICLTVTTNPESCQEYLQLTVKDTGEGVPEKNRSYLFDPFFTTKAGGTGLGLSVAYAIIQKHNGRIEVESEVGAGSSFVLSLPVQEEEAWKKLSSSTMT